MKYFVRWPAPKYPEEAGDVEHALKLVVKGLSPTDKRANMAEILVVPDGGNIHSRPVALIRVHQVFP